MKRTKNILLLLGLLSTFTLSPLSQERVDIPLVKKQASGKSTADETEPGDFNIYFRSNLAREFRNYVWAWNTENDLSALFPMSSAEAVTFPELEDDSLTFLPLYLNYGTQYAGVSEWSSGTDITFQITKDNFFTGFVFRDETGSDNYKTKDFVLEPEKFQPEEDGTINVYIDDDKGVYYNLEDFPTSPIDSVKYGEEVVEGKRVPFVEITPKSGKDLKKDIGDVSTLFVNRYNYIEGVKTTRATLSLDATKSILEEDYGKLYFRDETPLSLTYHYELMQTLGAGKNSSAGDISFLRYYSSEEFDSAYATEKKLGAFVNGDATVFRLWSPTSTSVTLNLYPESQGTDKAQYSMKKDANGVFEVALKGNLSGYYYTFDLLAFGSYKYDIADPYAYSSNSNGKRSMVVDFDSLDGAEEFEKETDFTPEYENAACVTIMEMHTRDFSMSESWNGSEKNRGKFKGLIEEGTTVSKDGVTKKTGFDYVKELKENGLTHVQIMPAYDFGSVDEDLIDDPEYNSLPYNGAYNWGYDPQQYNAPEGSYSSDPNDGYARVEEFRDFVETYNENGIGVVMDVVYNHMPAQSGSTFEDVFPGYYFRTTNYSGAGADIASQRTMVRKFIVDSVVSWVENYHVSGFRFDLMGLLDLDTMIAVRQAVDKIDPDILVYGEGWSMFGGDEDYGERHTDMAVQSNLEKMGEDFVGAFNDDFRDAISGGNTDPNAYGFVQDALDGTNFNSQAKARLNYGLSGTYYVGGSGRFTYSWDSSDGLLASIAYAECHDNMTLYDKFSISTANLDKVDDEVIMANDTVLGALSPSFFQMGQDFGRSKKITDEKYLVSGNYYEDTKHGLENVWYSHNSYNLSDDINAIDWNNLITKSNIKERFDKALRRRHENSLLMGETYSCTDFNNVNRGGYKQDLYPEDKVLSYSLQCEGGVYYFVQNYSNADYTIPGTDVVVPRGEVLTRFLKN